MKVLIIGSGPQALFMLKLYIRITNNVFLASLGNKVASHSNIPKKIYFFESNEKLASFIKSELNNWDLICFAGGYEIQSILDIAPEIFNEENVQPNKLDALKLFASKKETYRYSKALNISSLPSIKLCSVLSDGVTFDGPYLLKWDEENTNPKYNNFKTKVFTDLSSLIGFSKNFDSAACNKLIIQKFLKVSAGCNVSYLGYYTQGKHRFGMLGQQLLQYPTGITAHLVEYAGDIREQLISSAVNLIESAKLEGFCEVEFLIDPTTNDFYLLEVNPRPCGWSSALLGKYQNISAMLVDNESKHLIKHENVEWINILRYLRGSLDKGVITFLQTFTSVPFMKCYDIFSLTDIKPFFSQFKSKK